MDNFQYIIRTDLALQNKKIEVESIRKIRGIEIRRFKKKSFSYTNILFRGVDEKKREGLKRIFKKELKTFLDKYEINRKDTILVVGLGNKKVLSDSLGIRATDYVAATGYIKDLVASDVRGVYTFLPGVIKDTGMMSFRSIRAITRELKPSLIIIIDSLICSDITYLNRLIQITDEGITPGSGIINYQTEISKKTLKAPVVVVGVPTATFASTIIKDALNLESEALEFKKGYDLVVASKDIDMVIDNMSKIIGEGLNEILNKD